MAFLKDKTRKIMDNDILADVDVLSVPITQMIFKDSSHTVYFEKLGYKGCPSLANKRENLIDMNRWDQVTDIYEILIKIVRSSRTKINIFNAIVQLVKHCDKKNINIILSSDAIKSFILELKKRYHEGVKGKTLAQIQNSIKIVLLEYDPRLFSELEKEFISYPNDTSPIEPYTDSEVKKIVIALYKIFNTYRKMVLDKTVPIVHPLYDESYLISNNNYNGKFTKSAWAKKIRSNNNVDSWKNELIRTSFFLTSFYTGLNESTLINLKYSDISDEQFDVTSRGNFKLNTVKKRQKGRINIIDVGFSLRAKEFFETWLILGKIVTNNKSDYVFPSLVNGVITKLKPANASVSLNNTFKQVGLPLLSTQRFRKTKATIIMRSTESIFTVAEGLNNSPNTVSKHYSDGNSTSMKFSIAMALDVRQKTVNGERLDEAIKNSAYKFSDPVREQFYLKNNLTKPSILSNGLRCKEPFGKKAKRLKKNLIKAGLAESDSKVACYKFLECFGCEHHAIIAEAEDIWLLLSFRDVILEYSSMPSINSLPTNTLTKVINTIESILERLKLEYTENYYKGYNKYNISPHPLWSDKSDMKNIMDLF
ncbi:TPA: site-specific integrase [Photobacterium damselae]